MRVFYVSLIVVILDQITKVWVKATMAYGSSIPVFGDFFKITFVENPGMAFGLNVGPLSKFFLSLFSIIASIGLIFYIFKIKKEKLIYRLSIALILGGAVGNLIDRVFYGVIYGNAPLMYGKVVDFLNVEFFDFTLFGHTYSRWPIFNIADASVTIGVFILLIFNHKINKSEKQETEGETEKLEAESEGAESISKEKIAFDANDKKNNVDDELVDRKPKNDQNDNGEDLSLRNS